MYSRSTSALGMHQFVGERAIGGEEQQTGGVDVEPADGDPARALQSRQLFEDGRAAFGIVARGDHAFGFVEHQYLRVFGVVDDGDEKLAVHLDAVADFHAGTE